MIGFLRGRIVLRRPPVLVLDVGGVGYEIEAPLSTFSALPDGAGEVMLYTHLAIRDDSQYLYGFANEEERRLFRALIRTSGVGAKLALAILSGLSVAEFSQAVMTRDVATLKRLPGIGQKTAERLLVEMADRLEASVTLPVGSDPLGEAASALSALGYKPREVSAMLNNETAEGRSSEEIVRAVLKRSLRGKR
ncbi:MAG: Holliday junction branch migration protein RuvA [Gammaproteobacteria bacterium]|nr:Holliday junction branch migration protein RuvA [Gammaproteobacteria bacterium]